MEKSGSKDKSNLPAYGSFALVAVAVGLYFLHPGVNQFAKEAWSVLTSGDEARISAWVVEFSWWGPVILILSMTVQMFLLVIPSLLLMVVTVVAYGPYAGVAIILAGIFCASSIGYWIGHQAGASLIDRIMGPKSKEKVINFLEEYGFWAVFITRLSPFLSNDAVSFVGGILKMGYWRFIGASLSGILPLTLLIAYLGKDVDRLTTGLLWIGIVSLIGFIAYVLWDKRRTHGKA